MIALMTAYRLQVHASFTFVYMVNNLDHSLRFHYFYLDFYSRKKMDICMVRHDRAHSGISRNSLELYVISCVTDAVS